METSLRYGGYSNSLRIHAKEKLSIDSKTYLQVLSFSFLFLYAVFGYTECVWKMRLKLGHFCYGNVSAFWLGFWVLYNLLLLLLFVYFYLFFCAIELKCWKVIRQSSVDNFFSTIFFAIRVQVGYLGRVVFTYVWLSLWFDVM